MSGSTVERRMTWPRLTLIAHTAHTTPEGRKIETMTNQQYFEKRVKAEKYSKKNSRQCHENRDFSFVFMVAPTSRRSRMLLEWQNIKPTTTVARLKLISGDVHQKVPAERMIKWNGPPAQTHYHPALPVEQEVMQAGDETQRGAPFRNVSACIACGGRKISSSA